MCGTLDSVSTLLTSVGLGPRASAGTWRGLPAELWVGREQAVLERREPAGQWRFALDHLEHRLLLAEQVLVGSGDDRHRAVGTDPGRLELLDRSRHGVEFTLEAPLEADERFLRTDGEGGDDDAFDQLIRVAAHQGAVLERAGLAFGAVAHDEASSAGLPGDARPFATRREPATPTSTQPGRRDHVDGRRRADLLRPLDAEAAPVGGQVRIE